MGGLAEPGRLGFRGALVMSGKSETGASVFYEKIRTVIRAIPPGRVASYGQVADLAGYPRGSRLTALVLRTSTPQDALPWFRVLRRDGWIAIANPDGRHLQKTLLEAEGVRVSDEGRVDREFFWNPEPK